MSDRWDEEPHLPDLSEFYTSSDGDDDADSRDPAHLAREAQILARNAWSGDDARYGIGEVIAVGGMGAILRAWDRDADREVAMKVMLRSENEAHVERFTREARIVAGLQHPNIVPVHEIGVSPHGDPYFTMKRIRGQDLATIIARLRRAEPDALARYPVPDLVAILMKICDGVAFAHSRAILHLDLKPNNIQVGDYGEVVVLDWGLARPIGDHRPVPAGHGDAPAPSHTADGTVKGTPGFMAPEQAAGQVARLDPRTDVFSLGAILYMMLTFKCPIVGENSYHMLKHTRRAAIVPPDQRAGSHIPSELGAVAMKAMAFAPEDRYQSVAELQHDLQAFQAGRATRAEQAGLLKHIGLLIARHRAEAGVLLAAVVVVLLLVAAFMAKLDRERQRALAQELDARLAETTAIRETERARNQAEQAAAARAMAEYNAYVANVRFAAPCIAGRRFELARKALSSCPPALRNWEWGHLYALARQDRRTISFPTGTAAAIDARDRSLLLIRPDGPLQRRALTNAGPDRRYDAVTGPVTAIYAAGSNRLAVARPDRSVQVWDLDTERLRCTFNRHRLAISAIALDPEGLTAVSADLGGAIWVWDARNADRAQPLRGHEGAVVAMTISGDGRHLLTASRDGTARLWRIAENRLLRVLHGHHGPVTDIAAAADFGLIATTAVDGAVRVWRDNTARPILACAHDAAANAVTIPNPDTVVAGYADFTVRAWDLDSGDAREVFAGHTAPVTRAWTIDENQVLTAAADNTLKLWRLGTARRPVANVHTKATRDAAVSPDGRWIATAGAEGAVAIWPADDWAARTMLAAHRPEASAVAFDADGTCYSGGADGHLLRWDPAAPDQPPEQRFAGAGPIVRIRWCPNANRIAIATETGQIRLLPADATADTETVALTVAPHRLSAFDCSADARYLAAGSPDGSLAFWDRRDDRHWTVEKAHTAAVRSIAIPPGRPVCVSGGADGMVRTWDLDRGRLVRELRAHAGTVADLTFTADGRRLASAGSDRTIHIWDWSNGEELATLRGHHRGITTLAFTPDQLQLLAGTADGHLTAWRARPWRHPVPPPPSPLSLPPSTPAPPPPPEAPQDAPPIISPESTTPIPETIIAP